MLNKNEVKTLIKIAGELVILRGNVNDVIDACRGLENHARLKLEESLKYGLRVDGLKEQVNSLLLNSKKEKT